MAALSSLAFAGLLLFVAVGVVWTIWSALALVLARRKGAAVVLGLPVAIVIVIATSAGLGAHASRPATLFEREFGFAPTADVAFVNTSNFSLGDSGSTYLHFTASAPTLARVVAGAGLAPGAPHFATNARPAWFTPPPAASAAYSRSAPRAGGGFASEMRILRIDPTTGAAWFEFVGVD